MNLAEALDIHAAARPDHPAIVAGDGIVSHADFAQAVRTTAGRLAAAGIAAGDVVGVCLKDTVDHLVANFALARLGAIILPMDWRWTPVEKLSAAGHFGTRLVVVEDGEAPIGDLRVSTLDALPEAEPAPVASPGGGETLPLLLSLSSGTTGRPKGPCITHHQMLRRFWTHWINLGLNATDRYVSATPLYFGGGRTFAMSVLFAGGTVILFPPPFDAEALAAELRRRQATSTFLVPTQLRKLLEAGEAERSALGGLRLLISSGAPLDPEERTAIASLCGNFIEYYASTEGGGISIATPQTRQTSPDSVGRPVFGVEIEIVSDDHLPLPRGQVGLLRYRGPGVATGYFREEADQTAFRDGWFYPGDLAEIDAGGNVTLRGRRKDMIIRGGVNIYPAEIEQVLREHPSVADAAVVGRPSTKLGETVAAFVVAAAGFDEAALAAWCAARLAPYKVPESFARVDDLPRNSAGKVLKAVLVERLGGG
jgi:acyl-CoA synthetase (AMP-forming)/AMP-acid ligase II